MGNWAQSTGDRARRMAARLDQLWPMQSPRASLPIRAVRAPGRINLMGDHTDYNDGFVLPAAIDRSCVVVFRPNSAERIRAASEQMEDTVDLDARGSTEPRSLSPKWARYLAGVVRALADAGLPGVGIDMIISSNVPLGSGLSSSAALEVSAALALLEAARYTLDPTAVARACRIAEEMATGVPCGIMDQLVSLAGKRDHLMLIDCRAETWEYVPLPKDLSIVAVHSGITRSLEDTSYTERRNASLAAAVRMGLPSLRDASLDAVSDDPLSRHVIKENARVLSMAQACRSRDLLPLGSLMSESHASLRDDYAVSTQELDVLVQSLLDAGAIGARLTGAGFGGCVVALFATDTAGQAEEGAGAYAARTGLAPVVYPILPSDGAGAFPI